MGCGVARSSQKFDRIVEFAELQRFMDTPVKRYSSGMYMRLAFAVAAHLEPDILIVDEVLAVGDAAFQRRCIGKMEESAQEGRTVLFVSHNMQAVKTLCQRAVYLEGGRIKLIDDAQTVVQTYLDDVSALAAERTWDDPTTMPGDAHAKLRAIRVTSGDGAPSTSFFSSQPVTVEIECEIGEAAGSLAVGFDLETDDGNTVLTGFHTDAPPDEVRPLERGGATVRCECLQICSTQAATPSAHVLGIHGAQHLLRIESVIHFEVVIDDDRHALSGFARPGPVAPTLAWSVDLD